MINYPSARLHHLHYIANTTGTNQTEKTIVGRNFFLMNENISCQTGIIRDVLKFGLIKRGFERRMLYLYPLRDVEYRRTPLFA